MLSIVFGVGALLRVWGSHSEIPAHSLPKFFLPTAPHETRVRKFAEAMEWRNEADWAENFLTVQNKISVLENFLSVSRAWLTAALVREEILGENDSVSDWEVFARLFSRVPDFVLPMLLEFPARETLLKTVTAAGSAISFERVAAPVCSLLLALESRPKFPIIRKRGLPVKELRWSQLCGSPISMPKFFASVSAAELYLVTKAVNSRSTKGTQAILLSLQTEISGDERVIRKARTIPPEVAPLQSVLCRNFHKTDACKEVVSAGREFFDRHENFLELMLAVRDNVRDYMPAYEGNFQEAFLSMEADYGLEPTSKLMRVLRLNEVSSPAWPLLDRLLANAHAPENLTIELEVVAQGFIWTFLRAHTVMCFRKFYFSTRCWYPDFKEISTDELYENLLDSLDADSAAANLAYRFVNPENHKNDRLEKRNFLNKRFRTTSAIGCKECEICTTAFSDEVSDQQAVELCAPRDDFQGHFMCRICTTQWLKKNKAAQLTCPFCRSVVDDTSPASLHQRLVAAVGDVRENLAEVTLADFSQVLCVIIFVLFFINIVSSYF